MNIAVCLFQRKQQIHKNRADQPIQGITYKVVDVFLRNETLVKHTSVHRFEIKIEPQSNGMMQYK